MSDKKQKVTKILVWIDEQARIHTKVDGSLNVAQLLLGLSVMSQKLLQQTKNVDVEDLKLGDNIFKVPGKKK